MEYIYLNQLINRKYCDVKENKIKVKLQCNILNNCNWNISSGKKYLD